MDTFNLLNIYFYKIIELRKFCNEFTLPTNGTKTNIINRILQYYLINTHNKKYKLCNDMRCKTCFYNSFLSNSKSLYWSNKNTKNPRYVTKSNGNKIYFNCEKCNHEFTMRLNSITSRNSWCSYCSNNNLCENENCNICFNKSFASHEKAIYWSNKNIKTPRDYFKYSHDEFIFNCNVCTHEFSMVLSSITSQNSWCNYCSNNNLCEDNDCNICFNKSFASHEKAIYWSNKNIKTPRDYFKYSHDKFIFNCNVCTHEFTTRLSNITSRNSWCNYCSNDNLCENENCNICFNKSFASHEKSIYWNNKNSKNPRDVFKSSDNSYIFNCNVCTHEFTTRLSSVTNKNSWCSYCSNTILCKNNDCEICFTKSFASHEKSIYWSNKNSKTPRDYFKGNSSDKFIFNCNVCNLEFTTLLNSITCMNSWCPICVNKTEKLLGNYFKETKIYFIKEYTLPNGKYKNSNNLFRYDFYLSDYNIIIELDGMQHFEYIKHWNNDVKINQYKDCFKMKFAINNIQNLKIIRICQEDIYNNKINYKELLQQLLNNNNLQQITYISNDISLYDNHKQYMKLNINELNNFLI